MPVTLRQTFAVTPTGVGRTDYSQGVEASVEPIIRSWQAPYQVYSSFHLTPLTSHIEEFLILAGFVAVPFDFYLSSIPAVALDLAIDVFSSNGIYERAVQKSGTQFIDVRVAKGIPFTTKWRITARNNDAFIATDCYFSAFGITAGESSYYGE